MDNTFNIILNILGKIRRRVLIKIVLRNFLVGICLALVLGVLMGLLSRIIPIYRVYTLWGYIGAAIVLISLMGVFVMWPKQKKMAQLADSFGLQERVLTCLELDKEESVYKELLITDTLGSLKKLNYKEKISLTPHKNILITLFILIIAFGITVILPQPLKDEARQSHELSVYKKEQKEKVEKSQKDVKNNYSLTEKQKKDLLSKLDELKQELKKVKNVKEADKVMEKTAKKLEQDANKIKAGDLQKLAERLAENKQIQKLAEALTSGNRDKINKQLEDLKSKIKSMDSAARDSLRSALNNAAGALNDGELKDSINGLSSAISSGNENAINKSVDGVKGAAANSISQQNMNQALAQAQSNLQGQQGSTSAQGQSQGNGAGQGQGQGQGQGNGPGQGAGGSGAGSGAGSGSSNGDGGTTPYAQGGIGNKQPSAGKEKEYEKIFTPSRLGGQGQVSSVTGKSNGAGKSETSITDDSNAVLGELKPYNQVVGEYSEKAMESMDNSSIPGGMEDIIKNYFSSLQD